MAKRRSMSFWLYTGSIGLHVSLAVGAVLLPKPKRVESVAISLFEQKKAETKAPEPPPPPPPKKDPPKREPAKAKAAPAPEPAEAKAPEPAPAPEPAANAMDGFADLGMAMGNGGGGLAIPQPQKVAAAAAPKATAAPVATTKKVRALAAKAEDTCDEPVVKPKPRSIVKPAYTSDARTASVEGVVRVEITVDEEGRVIQARVLKGLGYGLDEAAVAAARQMTFDPGTRCGKAAVTTLSIGMRFALGS